MLKSRHWDWLLNTFSNNQATMVNFASLVLFLYMTGLWNKLKWSMVVSRRTKAGDSCSPWVVFQIIRDTQREGGRGRAEKCLKSVSYYILFEWPLWTTLRGFSIPIFEPQRCPPWYWLHSNLAITNFASCWCQFHQKFMLTFFVQKWFAQLFSAKCLVS